MRFFHKSAVAAAVLSAAGCASAQEPIDPFDMSIRAGRLGVMTGRSAELLGERPESPANEDDSGERARIADDLRIAVYDLARLKMDACPQGKLSPTLCKSDYAPAWGLRRDAAPPSWAELYRRIADAHEAIMPVWSELCDAARAKANADEAMEICPME